MENEDWKLTELLVQKYENKSRDELMKIMRDSELKNEREAAYDWILTEFSMLDFKINRLDKEISLLKGDLDVNTHIDAFASISVGDIVDHNPNRVHLHIFTMGDKKTMESIKNPIVIKWGVE